MDTYGKLMLKIEIQAGDFKVKTVILHAQWMLQSKAEEEAIRIKQLNPQLNICAVFQPEAYEIR